MKNILNKTIFPLLVAGSLIGCNKKLETIEEGLVKIERKTYLIEEVSKLDPDYARLLSGEVYL